MACSGTALLFFTFIKHHGKHKIICQSVKQEQLKSGIQNRHQLIFLSEHYGD
jgi:hypothetical protein